MTNRIVKGIITQPDGQPLVGGLVRFALTALRYNPALLPTVKQAEYSAETKAGGGFSISLTCNEGELFRTEYRCTLPDNSFFFFTLNYGDGADVDLNDVIAQGEMEATVAALLEHAKRVGSGGTLGHFKVGEGLEVDSSGALKVKQNAGGVTEAVAAHVALPDPHAQYLTKAGAAGYAAKNHRHHPASVFHAADYPSIQAAILAAEDYIKAHKFETTGSYETYLQGATVVLPSGHLHLPKPLRIRQDWLRLEGPTGNRYDALLRPDFEGYTIVADATNDMPSLAKQPNGDPFNLVPGPGHAWDLTANAERVLNIRETVCGDMNGLAAFSLSGFFQAKSGTLDNDGQYYVLCFRGQEATTPFKAAHQERGAGVLLGGTFTATAGNPVIQCSQTITDLTAGRQVYLRGGNLLTVQSISGSTFTATAAPTLAVAGAQAWRDSGPDANYDPDARSPALALLVGYQYNVDQINGIQVPALQAGSGRRGLRMQTRIGGVDYEIQSGPNVVEENVTYYFEISYDGAVVKLFLGRPGQTANLVASVKASGLLTQYVYEDAPIGIAPETFANFAGFHSVFPGYLDSLHISNLARHTAPFSAPVAKHEPDGNTVFLTNFERADDIIIKGYRRVEAVKDVFLVQRNLNQNPQLNGVSLANFSVLNGSGIYCKAATETRINNILAYNVYDALCLFNNSFASQVRDFTFIAFHVGIFNLPQSGANLLENIQGTTLGYSIVGDGHKLQHGFLHGHARAHLLSFVFPAAQSSVFWDDVLCDDEDGVSPHFAAHLIMQNLRNAAFHNCTFNALQNIKPAVRVRQGKRHKFRDCSFGTRTEQPFIIDIPDVALAPSKKIILDGNENCQGTYPLTACVGENDWVDAAYAGFIDVRDAD